MAKKIVVCFDGTWNVPKQSGGELEHHETNVVKMFRSILGEDMSPGQLGTSAQSPRGARTVKWYDRGVGTDEGGWHENRGILKKCVNSQAVYPLSEQHGLKARERRYTAHEEGKHWE